MKFLKSILQLSIVWVASIIGFAFCFAIFVAAGIFDIGMEKTESLFGAIFIGIITFIAALFFGLLFSIPGFLFFTLFGYIVLILPAPTQIKKGFLLGINYLNILLHGIVGFYMLKHISHGNGAFYPLSNYITWLPNWGIIIFSTLAIVLLPFKTEDKKRQYLKHI